MCHDSGTTSTNPAAVAVPPIPDSIVVEFYVNSKVVEVRLYDLYS